MVIATTDGNVTTVDAPDSSTITAVGSDFRVGVKGDLLRVDADHGSAAFDPSAQTLAAVPGISPETPFVWLDATHYAYANDKGVKVGTLGKSTTDSLDLGTDTCPAISEPFNPHSPLSSSTTPSGAPTSCAITAGALAVDAEGTIYAAPVGKRYVTRLTTKPRR